MGPGYRYLQIVRSLAENNAGQDGDMAELLGGFSFEEGTRRNQDEHESEAEDEDMMRAEEDDREVCEGRRLGCWAKDVCYMD